MRNPKSSILLLPWLLLCLVNPAFAQNLPAVQKVSLRLPANLKIDGQATEWNNTYQSYNNSTSVYYTIANDDTRLYLIVHAKDAIIAKKILVGGVTLTINNSAERVGEGNSSITFPLLDGPSVSTISQSLNEIVLLYGDSAKRVRQTDSIILLMNKKITTECKQINIKGISALNDTLISVYNKQGIRANIAFDNKSELTYELSIPVKLLGLSTLKSSVLKYNIMLNGNAYSNKPAMVKTTTGFATVTNMPRGLSNSRGTDFMTLNYPTDFWGDYTLIK